MPEPTFKNPPLRDSGLSKMFGLDPRGISTLKWVLDKQKEQEHLKDTSYGLGISPELETIVSTVRDPAGTALDLGFQKLGSMNLPGAEGINTSMIPTRTNLVEFLRRMRQAKAFDVAKYPEASVAEKFIHARYPKLSAQLFPLKVQDPNIFTMNTGGFFHANDNKVTLINQGRQRIEPQSVFDMTNTLAHEGTHARDFRNPVSVVPKEQFFIPEQEVPGMPGVKGTYITPNESVAKGGNYDLYKNQLVEQRAHQAGKTAGGDKSGPGGALKQFLDLLPDAPAQRERFVVNSPSIPNEIERATSIINAAEKAIRTDYPKDEADKYIKILRERKDKVISNIKDYEDYKTYLTKKPPEKPYYELAGDAIYGSYGLPHSVMSRLRNRLNFPVAVNFNRKTPEDYKLLKLIKDTQSSEGIGNITAFMKKQMDIEKKFKEAAEAAAFTDAERAKIAFDPARKARLKADKKARMTPDEKKQAFWEKMEEMFGEGDVTGKMFPPAQK